MTCNFLMKKKIVWGGDKIDTRIPGQKAGYRRTLQLLDQIGPVGRFGEKQMPMMVCVVGFSSSCRYGGAGG